VSLDSDARFAEALARAQRSKEVAAFHQPARTVIRSRAGAPIAKVTDETGRSRIIIDRTEHAAFADFVVRELPDLFERFKGLGAGSRRPR
jgi:hypothetical protein